jgi:hypothetical protein
MFARFFDQNGIPIGTIAYINGKPINSSKDIDQALSAQRGIIQILHLMDPRYLIFRYVIIKERI